MSERFSPSLEEISPAEQRTELQKIFDNTIQQWAGAEQDIQFLKDRLATEEEGETASRSQKMLEQEVTRAEDLADSLVDKYDQLIVLTPQENKPDLRNQMLSVLDTVIELERDPEIANRYEEIREAITRENEVQFKLRKETDEEMSARISQDPFHSQLEDPFARIEDAHSALASAKVSDEKDAAEQEAWEKSWDAFGESTGVPQVTQVSEPSQKQKIRVEQPTREELIERLRDEIQNGGTKKTASNPLRAPSTRNPLEPSEASLSNN